MIDVRLDTLAGCWMVIDWAIIPPIDTPTTWARSISRQSSRAAASSAMSLTKYGDLANRRDTNAAAMRPYPGSFPVVLDDKPTSRLS